MSKNFSNFLKGPDYKETLDILGDGIFNSDSELWSTQRRLAHSLINHRRFHLFLEKTSFEKVKNGLIPVLEHVVEQGLIVDLQDVFQRFTFDSTSILLTGMDPGCLSIKFPNVPFAKALDEAEEALMYRHCMPKICWKLLR
ncbi:hypothetical protein BVC80_9041g32 [Macleaya cordata]|uniref:Cytochrome P450 n=1 Tax=Macleaya cordata TaxID=56857 RepID=A0A200R2S9_MACCD|nr:hypothetical protein BVC80_9041g32 [Macleaya cordata]